MASISSMVLAFPRRRIANPHSNSPAGGAVFKLSQGIWNGPLPLRQTRQQESSARGGYTEDSISTITVSPAVPCVNVFPQPQHPFAASSCRRESQTAYYRIAGTGQPRYSLLYGLFDTPDDAREAAEKLPADLRSEKPWIRRLADVQAIIRQDTEATAR